MCIFILIVLLQSVNSEVFFEELKTPLLHPRTFYLSPHQEFQVISHVLCQDLPCPAFNVVQDHSFFIQQRSYRSSTFLKLTSPQLCNFNSVLKDGVQRMMNYTKGANNREQHYSLTLPLLIEIKQHTGTQTQNPWCIMSYSANFFTPHFWGMIATPIEMLPDYLELGESLKIYAHTFHGDVEQVLLREIELFRRNLDTIGLCYKKRKFYVAIYNILHSPGDSRTELWFAKCTK